MKMRVRAAVVSFLLERDGQFCTYCSLALGDDATIDHRIPVSEGGPDLLENFRLMHMTCNVRSYQKGRSKPGHGRGYKRTDAHRENIRKSLLGKKLSDAHKAAISAGHEGLCMSAEQRLAISKSLTGRRRSEETKERISVGQVRRHLMRRQTLGAGEKVS